MAVDPSTDPTLVAFQRFGYGARPGDRAAIASDPRGALLAELKPQAALIAGLPDITETFALFTEAVADRKLRRYQQQQAKVAKEAGRRKPAGEAVAMAGSGDKAMAMAAEPGDKDMAMGMEGGKEAPVAANRDAFFARDAYRAEVAARLGKAKAAQIGYLERLVAFWSNHFAVEAKGGRGHALVGPYDREAIRPHVLGKFSDMVNAVAKHATMLIYLDNYRSVGPNSAFGQQMNLGLNENFAREMLELHTLGVDGGYTQADVTAFARVLTGWTFQPGRSRNGDAGQFFFSALRHEPGTQTVLGKAYPAEGVRQGEAVLADLVRRPATARHIATKLAVAFVSDVPDPGLVATLERAFTESEGDLGHVSRTLIASDAAWAAPIAKFRSPTEYIAAGVRALDLPTDQEEGRFLVTGLHALGQEMWKPASPKGFPITGRDWIAPDALTNRLDLAQIMAQNCDAKLDPRKVLDEVIGPSASPETREAIARAESPRQGLALLLMSPEFQRR